MSSFSDFLENNVLDHCFRNTSYTPPVTVYVALYTAAPSDAGGGTQVTGNNYARTAVTFGAASGGSISNSGDVTFPTASGGSWGTVTHAGVFDASSAGNLMAWGPLTASKTVDDGDTFKISTGNLTITLA